MFGQSSSVATSINNQGQVVGISYNSSDGYFASNVSGPAAPPRFAVTGPGAQSFLCSDGQMTQINPVGGLAMSINNSGQVVGGPYSSINDSGQYVGGNFSGIYNSSNIDGQQEAAKQRPRCISWPLTPLTTAAKSQDRC